MHFLRAYCQTWWLPHFLWNKHIDPRTKQPGFLARHMAVRYYVQSRDLDDLMQNWSTNPFFKNFIDSFPQNEEYTKEELAKQFFKRQAFQAMEAKVLTLNARWRAFHSKTCGKLDPMKSNTTDSTHRILLPHSQNKHLIAGPIRIYNIQYGCVNLSL